MKKLCKICNVEKPIEECRKDRFRCKECHIKIERERYHRDKEKHKLMRSEYYQENKEYTKEKSKKWYKQNSERAKERILKDYYNNREEISVSRICKKYNIAEDQYNKMVQDSNNICEICLMEIKKGCVDHCHKTGRVRGYICGNCNSAIGFLKENKEIIERAAKYLDKNSDESDYAKYFFGSRPISELN